jgi:hypothetical protein
MWKEWGRCDSQAGRQLPQLLAWNIMNEGMVFEEL